MLCLMREISAMNSSKEMRACRVLLGWRQEELAEASGVHLSTIERMERLGPGHWAATRAVKVRHALENGGIFFLKKGVVRARIRINERRGIPVGFSRMAKTIRPR